MKKMILYPAMIIVMSILGAASATAQNRNTHYFQDAGTDNVSSATTAELFAFPNPATNNVTVQLPYIAQNFIDVLVLDFNGSVLRNFRFAPGGQSFSMDISYLNKGNYVVHVHEGNRLVGYVKLVKDR